MVIPTYNEADNLAWIVGRLRARAARRRRPGRRRQLARTAPARSPTSSPPPTRRSHVLHRTEQGRPRRGVPRTASRDALDAGYDVIGEMDADGSHQPEQLHRLLARAARRRPGDRLALGPGRLGGQLAAAPRGCSRAAATSTCGCCSGSAVRDATAGFRLFRRTTLEKIDLASVQSTGYVFQTDLVARTLRAGLAVREVPIEFVERVRGDSKMSGAVAAESLRRITALGPARARATRSAARAAGRTR